MMGKGLEGIKILSNLVGFQITHMFSDVLARIRATRSLS